MPVSINPFSKKLTESFLAEKKRLLKLLPSTVTIEHVGSSSVGIGGKNIVDILIGVADEKQMREICFILTKNGYFEGNDSYVDRIFLASKKGETGEGDLHIHICPADKDSYKDFLLFRDYLRSNPNESAKYENMKHKFAKEANYNRKEYKALKSEYVSKLLKKAKNLSK